MPKYIRLLLTPEQRTELNWRARARVVASRVRERLEMIRLSDLGWTIPQIAAALAHHDQTVRKYLKVFQVSGFAALADGPRSGRPRTVTSADLEVIERLLDEAATGSRTWTLGQLVGWLAETRRVTIGTDRLRVLLRQRRFRWKRTKRSVRHKQSDPDLQARKLADLETLIL